MNFAVPDATVVTPIGLAFILVMAVLTFQLSRRYASMPLLITMAYMPLGQEFVIAGLHFQFFRVLLLLGVIRVFSKHEGSDMVLTPLDRVFIAWGIAGIVLGTLAEPTPERLVNRLGEGFNAFSSYFLFRCWIRSLEDVIQTAKCLAVAIVPIAASMMVEKFTSHNIFAVFGGIPEITLFREGKLRCQGAFRHPILAGTYAATVFPMFVGLWFDRRVKKWLPIAGVTGAVVMTVAASSSGALMAIGAAFIGFALWGMRCQMSLIRRGLVFSILALAMVMKAPVWYLIARVSDVTGGTGWHRAYLIDQAVGHFNEWWLVGSTVTAHWAPAGQVLTVDPKNMDITNNYVAEGLGGGIVKLGLFIAMIVLSFKFVGRWTKTPDTTAYSRRMFVWTMGICLLGHCASFISISYFDQIVVMWYWLLAAMSMLCRLRDRASEMLPETSEHGTFNVPVAEGQH